MKKDIEKVFIFENGFTYKEILDDKKNTFKNFLDCFAKVLIFPHFSALNVLRKAVRHE